MEIGKNLKKGRVRKSSLGRKKRGVGEEMRMEWRNTK